MRYTFYFFLLFTAYLHAQDLDIVQSLPEVTLWSENLKEAGDTYKQKVINDSILQHSQTSFTNLLEQHSLIYFKENGLGMVSSPAFRGTNASQTAVLWNGIPINSSFTGQTDFNTVLSGSIDQLTIRSGSGSVAFGSGAIGGSIAMDQLPQFNKENQQSLKLGYGSFNSRNIAASSLWAGEDSFIKVFAEGLASDNDYKYKGKNKRNEDADFKHFSYGLHAGHRYKNHRFYLHADYYQGKRNFSGTIVSKARDGYRDYDAKGLLHWETYLGDFTSSLKLAYLLEEYKYYPNMAAKNFNFGKSHTLWSDYSMAYRINSDMRVSASAQFNSIEGKGSDIRKSNRKTGAFVGQFRHQVSDKWLYNLNLRQEFSNDYNNPFVFALDSRYNLTDAHAIRFNLAKNYRVPTFNDLYWHAGGNEDLNVEESLQYELAWQWDKGNYGFELTGYFIKSEDMIKWVPQGSIWIPRNISKAENYGAEFEAFYAYHWNEQSLRLDAAYAYTKAVDKELDKQLIYVPYHKLTGSLTYKIKDWHVNYTTIYNGEIYTSTDNKNKLKAYNTHQLNLGYAYNLKEISGSMGLQVRNLYDLYYENMPLRPMPGRHINFYLTITY